MWFGAAVVDNLYVVVSLAHTNASVHAHGHADTLTMTCACDTHMHMHACTNARTLSHTYTHTHTHTHTQHTIAALKQYRKFSQSIFALRWNLLSDSLLRLQEPDNAPTDSCSMKRTDNLNRTTSKGWMHLGNSGGVYFNSSPPNGAPLTARTQKLAPLSEPQSFD